MKLYGVNIINSAGFIDKVNEKFTEVEARTKLFTNESDAKKYAVEKVADAFSWLFDEGDAKEGVILDCNDHAQEEFEEALKAGENVCIQGYDSHICIEFFEQDMGLDIINRNDYVATKLWSEEDVKQALIDREFEGTQEEIDAVINTGIPKALGDCTDEDWGILDYAITTALGHSGFRFLA